MQWVDVLSALLTPTIAFLGIFIAFRQWRLARENFKEKLFDRRFELYNLAIDLYLETYLGDPKGSRIQELNNLFGEKRRQAEFILDSEIAQELEKLHNACLNYKSSESMMELARSERTFDQLTVRNDEARDAMLSAKERLPLLFGRYLRLGENI